MAKTLCTRCKHLSCGFNGKKSSTEECVLGIAKWFSKDTSKNCLRYEPNDELAFLTI